MNLGKLDPDVIAFVENHKKLGFTTKTQLVNEGVRLLRRERAADERRRWREDAGKQEQAKASGYIWESIDGEDFQKQ